MFYTINILIMDADPSCLPYCPDIHAPLRGIEETCVLQRSVYANFLQRQNYVPVPHNDQESSLRVCTGVVV